MPSGPRHKEFGAESDRSNLEILRGWERSNLMIWGYMILVGWAV